VSERELEALILSLHRFVKLRRGNALVRKRGEYMGNWGKWVLGVKKGFGSWSQSMVFAIEEFMFCDDEVSKKGFSFWLCSYLLITALRFSSLKNASELHCCYQLSAF